MILLTINMNMFNLDIDNSFNSYLDEIKPDITFIQECRYNRINRQNVLWAGDYTEPIDSRIHISAAIGKNGNTIKKRSNINTDVKYDYTCIFVVYGNKNYTGIHLPLSKDNTQKDKDYNCLLDTLNNSDSHIICGDFNATPNNENYEFIEKLRKDKYDDLWEVGLNEGKAYYINYSGKKIKANSNHKNLRTFIKNTHIDYILTKKKMIHLNKIIIDFRTLAFTDHCSIISYFKNKRRYV